MNIPALMALYEMMKTPGAAGRGPWRTDFVSYAAQGNPVRGLLTMLYDPRRTLSPDEMLLSSLHYCCAVVARYAQEDTIYIAQLDPDLTLLDDMVVPFFITGGAEEKRGFGGYHFKESPPGALLALFNSSPGTARELLDRIGATLMLDAPLPGEARRLATAVLTGRIVLPRRPAARPREDHRNTLLVALAKRVKKATGLAAAGTAADYTPGQPIPRYGCTIAAAALSAFPGGLINPSNAFKINQKAQSLLDKVKDLQDLTRAQVSTAELEAINWAGADEPVDMAPRVAAALNRLSKPI